MAERCVPMSNVIFKYMAGIVRLSTLHLAKGISAFHASFLARRINSTSTQQKNLSPGAQVDLLLAECYEDSVR